MRITLQFRQREDVHIVPPATQSVNEAILAAWSAYPDWVSITVALTRADAPERGGVTRRR